MTIIEWAVLVAVCLFAASVAVVWLMPRPAGAGPGIDRSGRALAGDPVWLFDGPELIEASARARALFKTPQTADGWAELHREMVAGYPEFPASQDDVRDNGPTIVCPGAKGEPTEIVCEWIDGVTRVQLRDTSPDNPGSAITAAPGTAPRDETLQIAMNQAPYPVWLVEPCGRVIWYNAAYEALLRQARGSGLESGPDSGPDPAVPLFPTALDEPSSNKKARKSIFVAGNEQKLWFDVTVVRHEQGCLCYAVDINAVVDAEIAQRNFVQTLAKTFAHMSIGLAIFDRNRQLALFNPALIDLTALPADFLSARPNLLSFFDRLRDQRLMPEPKNYGSWRHQMADLVAAAADGHYQETWSLPSGSVYSVSGRPHPDGAVAFLFEDITAEITLTRRFRSDLELGQSILDQLDDAIAVFSVDGNLTVSNTSYHKLWQVDPDNSFAQMSVLDATRNWQDHCKATPVWGEVRDFVASRENRVEWWANIRLKSGELLICNVYPIHGGATMVSFARPAAPATPTRQPEPGALARG